MAQKSVFIWFFLPLVFATGWGLTTRKHSRHLYLKYYRQLFQGLVLHPMTLRVVIRYTQN
jgi:hypothetical protein